MRQRVDCNDIVRARSDQAALADMRNLALYKSGILAKSCSYCITTIRTVVNLAKNFGIGACFVTVTSPLSSFSQKFANLIGLIPGLPDEGPCPWQQAVDRVNYGRPAWAHTTVSIQKIGYAAISVIYAPLVEELICRGLIQGLLLKTIPQFGAKKIFPDKEAWFDSTTARVARIIITSCIFSAIHLIPIDNSGPDISQLYQAVGALFGGLILGMIKESKLGLSGSIGLHMAHNVVSLIPGLLDC